MPSAPLCSVAMNLCSDSNGIASMRGYALLLGLPLHPELVRERVERALGRIALDLPDAVLLEQLGVVAEHRDAAEQRRAPGPSPAGFPSCLTSPSGA